MSCGSAVINLPVFSMVLLGFFDLAAALLSLDFPLFISLHHFCTEQVISLMICAMVTSHGGRLKVVALVRKKKESVVT